MPKYKRYYDALNHTERIVIDRQFRIELDLWKLEGSSVETVCNVILDELKRQVENDVSEIHTQMIKDSANDRRY